ncbi:MAG: hypothetical protein GY847_40100, partial [Proteobacteria bacterium]|nr:hypothetical protein [Pseudomonadota bacterium]
MAKMLEQRINDATFLRLIKKWLKAGIMEEDGRVLHPATGTPQGGILAPPTEWKTFRGTVAYCVNLSKSGRRMVGGKFNEFG